MEEPPLQRPHNKSIAAIITVLWYLISIMANVINRAAFGGAYAHCGVLSLTGNPSEKKWQIPQQGVEKEICHAV